MSKKILTLDNIPVINKKIGKVDTIEKLKASTIYSIGDVVEVLGFHTKGDGSHHKRIAKAEDDGSGEQGQNGIWWCVVHNGEVNVSWFGAKGDGVTDDIDIIKKAYAYSGKIVLDKSLYLSKTLFDIKNKFKVKCTFTHKRVIQSSYINDNLPKTEMLGMFNYSGHTDKSHQSLSYNANREEYVLGFSSKTESEASTLIVLDKNFKFLRKYEIDLGHVNGLAFNKNTNKLISCGYLGVSDKNRKIFVIDYDSMQITSTIDVGFLNIAISYIEEEDLYMVGSEDGFVILDNQFSEIESVILQKGDLENLTAQDGEFFKGNYCLQYYKTPACGKNYMLFYNLKGEEVRRIEIEAISKNDEPEGLIAINETTMISSNYWWGDKIIRFYNHNFDGVGANISDVNVPNLKSVYVDTTSTEIGDGSSTSPYSSIELALEKTKGSDSLQLYLKGDIDTETTIKYNGILEISPTSSSEKPIFKKRLNLIGIKKCLVNDIIFQPAQNIDRLLFVESCKVYLSGLTFVQPNAPVSTNTSRGIACYRSQVSLWDSSFKNCCFPITSSESSVTQVGNISGNGNLRRFRSDGGIIMHRNVSVGNTIDQMAIDSLLIPSNSSVSLDTPYYALKMQQERIYSDYVAYRDELHEYEKSQNYIEEQRQTTYESRENQEQTYEEWLSEQPQLMPISEPQIPATVQEFAKKYNLM